jgi:hypothetical protein
VDFLRAFVLHVGDGVPAGVEGEDQPMLIVYEAGSISFCTFSGRLLSCERTYVAFTGLPALSFPS